MTVRSRPSNVAAELPLPEGMAASTVELGGDQYLVLTVPIPTWSLPEYLTEAQRSITLAMLRGATNEDIARERKTSVRTVDNHVAQIFVKVGVASRIELAYRLGSKGVPP